MIPAAIISAAVGVAIGYTLGGVIAVRVQRRRRETSAMRQHAALTRVLARTARPNKGDA